MEGAAYIVLNLILLQGILSLVASLRFLHGHLKMRRRGNFDAALLGGQIILSLITESTVVAEMFRNSMDSVALLRDAGWFSLLIASLVSHIVMFLCTQRK